MHARQPLNLKPRKGIESVLIHKRLYVRDVSLSLAIHLYFEPEVGSSRGRWRPTQAHLRTVPEQLEWYRGHDSSTEGEVLGEMEQASIGYTVRTLERVDALPTTLPGAPIVVVALFIFFGSASGDNSTTRFLPEVINFRAPCATDTINEEAAGVSVMIRIPRP